MSEKEEVVFQTREEIWKRYFPKAAHEEDIEDASDEPRAYGSRLALAVIESVKEEITE